MNAALIVGISDYPPPISKLPAVAADVLEIGKLLNSPSGTFTAHVKVLTETRADRATVLQHLQGVFGNAGEDDTLFIYMAGHGAVIGDDYYFIAHDTDPKNPSTTAVPLEEIKRMFDGCRSNRLVLWLDFCHSGGIIPRQLQIVASSGPEAIRRTLKIVQGQGRIIFAACTPEQSAYEDPKLGHGVFTAYLLEGLRGAAAHDGEVTANALFDFIDRKMGSSHQRPMQFGQMTGRVVLVHHDSRLASTLESPLISGSDCGTTAIHSTGNWCLLGKSLFEASKVHRSADGNYLLEIASTNSETDAALAAMSPSRFGPSQPVPFAHRSDGMVVRIDSVESRSAGSEQLWMVAVKPDQNRHGGFGTEMSFSSGGRVLSPDDQAKLRAGRLLLNDPSPPTDGKRTHFPSNDSFIEGFIQGIGVPIPAKECLLQSVYKQMRTTDEAFLRAVRLTAVFMLRTTQVCEHILELIIGPVVGGNCHVRFRGQRAAAYHHVDPIEIELEGDCPLE